jgi:hypothetical protein
MSEVVGTVDLVLHAGMIRQTGAGSDGRARRLISVGFVSGVDDGRAIVRELVALGEDGGWHRVGSLEGAPERVRAKLACVSRPSRLLDGFDV